MTMPDSVRTTALSQEDIDRFDDLGFLVIRSVIDPQRLLASADQAAHLRQPPPSAASKYPEYPFKGFIGNKCLAEFSADELLNSERFMRLHWFDDDVRALMLDAALIGIAKQIFRGATTLAAHSAFFPKPPGSRGIAMHTDSEYFRPSPADMIGLSVAVDAAGVDNGALLVAERTHRPEQELGDGTPHDGSVVHTSFTNPRGARIHRLDVNPGDVAAFHASVLHGSEVNGSPTLWRRSFIFHYVNADTVKSISEDCLPLYGVDGAIYSTPPASQS